MKILICVISTLFITLAMYGQKKGALGIEVSTSYNQYNLGEFNKSIDKMNSSSPLILNMDEYSEISGGEGYGLAVNLQISQCFNLGIYGEYFSGKSQNEFILISGGDFGMPIDTAYWTRHHEVNSSVFGLKSCYFLSKSNFWKNYGWLSKVESAIELSVGYSFSRFIFYNKISGVSSGTGKEVNKVSGIHLKSQFKIGYLLTNGTYFSSIGLKVGYQYLHTSSLKGAQFNYFFNEESAPRLNFSGLTAGIYLTFGK